MAYERTSAHREQMRAVLAAKRPPVSVRLWARVARGGADECWLWTGPINGNGYGGLLRVGSRRRESPHRLAFMEGGVAIPPGLIVRHSCDVPLCCNPRHLLIGTNADNSADMARRGRARNRYTKGR